MNVVLAFLRLVRWPNLCFIALTQILFYYCVLPFVYGIQYISGSGLSQTNFYFIVLASVLIAAAGYIINDYFDLNIDIVNKPSHIIIDRFIKRRYAILFHIAISFSGLALSALVGYKLRNVYIPFLNLVSIGLLWFYSTRFKKELLVGNVIVSVLTAWVILILLVAIYPGTSFSSISNLLPRLLRVTFLYTGFAFIISLIREVLKDMEDVPGDIKYGCHTMPIKWGIPVSKVFSAVWLVVLTGAVLIVQFYTWSIGWWLSVIYSMIFILIPLIIILHKLFIAQTFKDYHILSGMVKFVMLTGILSMLFFRLYS